MTIYKGKTTPRNLMNLLNTIMLAEGYIEVTGSATLDGRVYRGTEGGKNEFYIQFKLPHPTNIAYSMGVGFYEKYTPGVNGAAGTFGNGYLNPQVMIWLTTPTYVNVDTVLTYIINANGSRLIVYVQGSTIEHPTMVGSLTFIGMPDRYDPSDTGAGLGGVGGTLYSIQPGGSGTLWRAIKSKALVPANYYEFWYNPAKTVGWGKSIFASQVCLIHSDEGPRGEFPGFLVCTSPGTELKHGDIIPYNGKLYMLLVGIAQQGNGQLPAGMSYLMEIEEGFDNGFLYR